MSEDRAIADLSFGHWRVSATQRQVWVDGQPARLGSRALDVLLALISLRERVVSIDELLDIVWPDNLVEEGNLRVHVSALRKLLGHTVISTIPGRGYRFTAAVEPAASHVPAEVSPIELRTSAAAESPFASIGRDAELRALQTLVAQHRVVTICGAGGIGKTHVAQQLLQRLRAADRRPIVWVDLSGLYDASLMPSAIAAALGVAIGHANPRQGLIDALRSAPLLLVLDNAEHLVSEVAQVAQSLVAMASRVQLLVTSQVPLHLQDEQVLRLGTLAVPSPDAGLEEAARHAAVALFVRRAAASDRRFTLTEANRRAVIDICRRLDGLPLAIELAAARVPVLGADGLCRAIDERWRLLTSGSRGAPPRQQTLRAALDWSHSLLSELEQRVFRRLGVFAAGFTLALAQQVAGDTDVDLSGDAVGEDWQVIDTLDDLIDRSLVAVDAVDPPRYRLLESPRAYALEQLVASGEQALIRRRHARAALAHFRRVRAEVAAGRIVADEERSHMGRELDNAREALAWAIANDANLAIELAVPMDYALTDERFAEQRRLWEQTERLITDAVPAALRARWAASCSRFWQGFKPEPARRWARVAVELSRGLDERYRLYESLYNLCRCDIAGADDEQRAALAEMRTLDDPGWSATQRAYRVDAELFVAEIDTNFDAALVLRQRALELAHAVGDTAGVFSARLSLPCLELRMGRFDDAARHGEPLVADLQQQNLPDTLDYARMYLVAAHVGRGDAARARAVATESLSSASRFGRQFLWAAHLAWLAALEHRPAAAARLLGYGRAIYRLNEAGMQVYEARAVAQAESLARVELGDAEFERCREHGTRWRDADFSALALGPPE